MATTKLNAKNQLVADTVTRADLNTDVVGSAVTAKIIAGTGITLTSTGADSGTGDVTINTSGGSTPTGTGFTHITSGAQDGAARAVNVSSVDVTGTLPVANGGTGNTTNTSHGVLLGNGGSAIGATAAGTAGQVLQSGGGAADPTWTGSPTITGANITAIPNGALSWQATAYITADVTTTTSANFVDATGLSFAIGASETWAFEIYGIPAATISKCLLAINGPATPTLMRFQGNVFNNAYAIGNNASAYDSQVSPPASNLNATIRITGLIQNGTNAGTVTLRIKSTDGTSTGVAAGTYLVARRLN